MTLAALTTWFDAVRGARSGFFLSAALVVSACAAQPGGDGRRLGLGDGGAADAGGNGTDAGVPATRATDAGAPGRSDAAKPDASTGMVDAAPVFDVDAPIEARPARTDDCDFGARTPHSLTLTPSVGADLLTVDDATVYFSHFQPFGWGPNAEFYPLYAVPRCGGDVRQVGTRAFQRINGLTEGGPFLYVSADYALTRVSKTDGASVDLGMKCPRGVATTPDSVFVYDCERGLLRGRHSDTTLHPVPGAPAPPIGTMPYEREPYLAVSGSSLLYPYTDGIRKWVPGNPVHELVHPTTDTIWALFADTQALFIEHTPSTQSANAPLELTRVGLGDGRISSVSTSIQTPDATVEAGTAYWLDEKGLRAAPTDGSTPPRDVDWRPMNHVAAYGKRLYWTEEGHVVTGLEQPPRAHAAVREVPALWTRTLGTPSASTDVAQVGFSSQNVIVGGSAYGATTDLGAGAITLGPQTPGYVATFEGPTGKYVSAELIGTTPPAGMQMPYLLGFIEDPSGAVVAMTSVETVSGLTPSGALAWTVLPPAVQGAGVPIVSPVTDTAGAVYFALGSYQPVPPVVEKVTSAGAVAWTKQFDLTAPATLFVDSIALADPAHLLLSATLQGTIDLGDGPHDSGNGKAVVLAQTSTATGATRFVRMVRGMESATATPLASGHAIVIGTARELVDVGSGPTYLDDALSYYTVVLDLAPDGSVGWWHATEGAFRSAVAPDGTVYLLTDGGAGYPAPFFFSPTGPGVDPPFLAKLDTSGSLVWTHGVGNEPLFLGGLAASATAVVAVGNQYGPTPADGGAAVEHGVVVAYPP